MQSLKIIVVLGVLLVYVHVVGATEGRTCVREVKYIEKVRGGFLWLQKKDVKKTREGLFCCDGYNPIHNQTLHYIEVKSNNECTPFCSPPCLANSTCQPPTTCECSLDSKYYAKHYGNRCKCNEGFMRTDEGQCTPICPDNCTNGICNELICICNTGYKVNSHQKCMPQCNGACKEYQECTNPGRCSPKPCKEPGYERNKMNECVPKCQDGCLNGNCTAPETCICNEGYQKHEANMTCEPQCDNCTNGFCMIPQECVCNLGFIDVEGVCAEMTTIEDMTDNMLTFSPAMLFFWVSVGLFLLVVLASIGYYFRMTTAAGNGKNEQANEASMIVFKQDAVPRYGPSTNQQH